MKYLEDFESDTAAVIDCCLQYYSEINAHSVFWLPICCVHSVEAPCRHVPFSAEVGDISPYECAWTCYNFQIVIGVYKCMYLSCISISCTRLYLFTSIHVFVEFVHAYIHQIWRGIILHIGAVARDAHRESFARQICWGQPLMIPHFKTISMESSIQSRHACVVNFSFFKFVCPPLLADFLHQRRLAFC